MAAATAATAPGGGVGDGVGKVGTLRSNDNGSCDQEYGYASSITGDVRLFAVRGVSWTSGLNGNVRVCA